MLHWDLFLVFFAINVYNVIYHTTCCCCRTSITTRIEDFKWQNNLSHQHNLHTNLYVFLLFFCFSFHSLTIVMKICKTNLIAACRLLLLMLKGFDWRISLLFLNLNINCWVYRYTNVVVVSENPFNMIYHKEWIFFLFTHKKKFSFLPFFYM